MEYQRIWLLVLFCLSSWDMHAQHFVIEGKPMDMFPTALFSTSDAGTEWEQ